MTILLFAYFVGAFGASAFIGSIGGEYGWSFTRVLCLATALWGFATMLYLGAKP